MPNQHRFQFSCHKSLADKPMMCTVMTGNCDSPKLLHFKWFNPRIILGESRGGRTGHRCGHSELFKDIISPNRGFDELQNVIIIAQKEFIKRVCEIKPVTQWLALNETRRKDKNNTTSPASQKPSQTTTRVSWLDSQLASQLATPSQLATSWQSVIGFSVFLIDHYQVVGN